MYLSEYTAKIFVVDLVSMFHDSYYKNFSQVNE